MVVLSSINEETEALSLLTQHRSGGCGELLHGCRTRLLGENFEAARWPGGPLPVGHHPGAPWVASTGAVGGKNPSTSTGFQG